MNILRLALPTTLLLLLITGCTSTERAAQNEAVSVARVMAINSSSALASGKEREGRLMVRSIADSPDVAFSLLFDHEKNLFADFFQPDQTARKSEVVSKVRATLPIGADYFIDEPDVVIAISRVEDSNKLLGFIVVGVRKK